MRELLEIVHPTKGRLLINPKDWEKFEAMGCTKVGEKVEKAKPQVPHDLPEQLIVPEEGE